MLQELYERLQALKQIINELPNDNDEDWRCYLALVRKYQALRDEYVKLGGCLI